MPKKRPKLPRRKQSKRPRKRHRENAKKRRLTPQREKQEQTE